MGRRWPCCSWQSACAIEDAQLKRQSGGNEEAFLISPHPKETLQLEIASAAQTGRSYKYAMYLFLGG